MDTLPPRLGSTPAAGAGLLAGRFPRIGSQLRLPVSNETTEGRLATITRVGRRTVPVELDVRVDRRVPEQIEITAYYVVAEALTNTAKHAHTSVAAANLQNS